MTELEDLKRIKYLPKKKVCQSQRCVFVFGLIMAFLTASLFIYTLFFA